MSYFTYHAILELLRKLDAAYGLFPLRAWKGQPGIVLRHDVDLDIDPAYRLALHQAEHGLRGTYYFLTSADTYNCLSRRNRALIREIDAAGMEVALHFDPSIYQTDDVSDLSRFASAEAGMLEDVTGSRIVSVSLHNPSISNQYPMLPGWMNAYDQALFRPEVYLSDSRMRFRSDPTTFFEKAREHVHQLTLHPMHYADEEPRYPKPHLNYLRRSAAELDEQFRQNSTYQSEVGDSFFERLGQDIAGWKD